MAYVWLCIAVFFEVGWATAMKLSDGFTRLVPALATVVMYLLSVVFLAFATRRMDIGSGYAIWAGSGAALIAVLGMTCFREPVTTASAPSVVILRVWSPFCRYTMVRMTRTGLWRIGDEQTQQALCGSAGS